MKPQLTPSPGTLAFSLRRNFRQPWTGALIEWDFQTRRFGNSFGSDLPERRPGFSALARKCCGRTRAKGFRLESAVLGFVALVSAWPIAIMIQESSAS